MKYGRFEVGDTVEVLGEFEGEVVHVDFNSDDDLPYFIEADGRFSGTWYAEEDVNVRLKDIHVVQEDRKDTSVAYGALSFKEGEVTVRLEDIPVIPEDFKDTNPKEGAATTRLDLTLFPDTAVAYGALAFTEGDLKYGGYNYREQGVSVSTYVTALRRHMAKYYAGEFNDPKTGVPHLANALGCIAILIDGHVMENLNDDRPPKIEMTKLLDIMELKVSHLQHVFPRSNKRCTESKPSSGIQGDLS